MSNQKVPVYKCVNCKNFTGTFQELCVHEEECEYTKIECSFEGCEFKSIRKEMGEHEKICKIGELQTEIFELKKRNEQLETKFEDLELKNQEKDQIISSLEELIKETQKFLKELKE